MSGFWIFNGTEHTINDIIGGPFLTHEKAKGCLDEYLDEIGASGASVISMDPHIAYVEFEKKKE